MALSLAQPVETPEIPNLPSYVHRTEVGLIIDKRNISFEEWEAGFKILEKNDKARQWEIGDYLADGEKRFGDDYVQVIDPDDEQERDDDGKGETYRSYQWVAERIPFVHRCTNVPWTLHRDVASMDAKDRNYWLQRVSAARAAGEKFSRRRLQKEIKAAQNPAKEPETLTEAMRALHEKVVREELTEKSAETRRWAETPPDPLLSTVYRRAAEMYEWQRDRTLEIDCVIIMQIFSGAEGTEGTDRATDSYIPVWLCGHGYIMGDEELDDRLSLMVRLKMLTVETREESRGPNQRGTITSVYAPEKDYADTLDEIEALQMKPERVVALHKDWIERLERYAPELLPKKKAA